MCACVCFCEKNGKMKYVFFKAVFGLKKDFGDAKEREMEKLTDPMTRVHHVSFSIMSK